MSVPPDQYDPAVLLDYVEGELDEPGRAAFEAAMEENPQLRELVEAMEADREGLRSMPRESAPPGLVEDARQGLERRMLLGPAPTDRAAGRAQKPKAGKARSGHPMGRWIGYGSLAAALGLAGGVLLVTLLPQGVVEQVNLFTGPGRAAGPTAPPTGSAGAGADRQSAVRAKGAKRGPSSPTAGDGSRDQNGAVAQGQGKQPAGGRMRSRLAKSESIDRKAGGSGPRGAVAAGGAGGVAPGEATARSAGGSSASVGPDASSAMPPPRAKAAPRIASAPATGLTSRSAAGAPPAGALSDAASPTASGPLAEALTWQSAPGRAASQSAAAKRLARGPSGFGQPEPLASAAAPPPAPSYRQGFSAAGPRPKRLVIRTGDPGRVRADLLAWARGHGLQAAQSPPAAADAFDAPTQVPSAAHTSPRPPRLTLLVQDHAQLKKLVAHLNARPGCFASLSNIPAPAASTNPGPPASGAELEQSAAQSRGQSRNRAAKPTPLPAEQFDQSEAGRGGEPGGDQPPGASTPEAFDWRGVLQPLLPLTPTAPAQAPAQAAAPPADQAQAQPRAARTQASAGAPTTSHQPTPVVVWIQPRASTR